MVQPGNDEAGQGRNGAVAAFEPQDYEQLVALAWRHQFDDDRTKFKRELRELQEHLSQQILDRLELSE
jgi:hypothetical protein